MKLRLRAVNGWGLVEEDAMERSISYKYLFRFEVDSVRGMAEPTRIEVISQAFAAIWWEGKEKETERQTNNFVVSY